MNKHHRIASIVVFGASAAASSGMVSTMSEAWALCGCASASGAAEVLDHSVIKKMGRASFQYVGTYENSTVWSGSLPLDSIYSFAHDFTGDSPPSIYFDYYPYALDTTTTVTACRQAYASSTATCSSNVTNTPSNWGGQDVPVNSSGIYSSSYSDWDYHSIRAWGNLGTNLSSAKGVIGGGALVAFW